MGRLTSVNNQYYDNSGDILSYGKLYFYTTGTLTAKTTYSDSALSTANANPVVLDQYGRSGDIFFDDAARVRVYDSNNVFLYEVDPVYGRETPLSGRSITAVTVATNDKVLIQDTSDSEALKTVTAASIAAIAQEDLDDATLTSVTPATDDEILLKDTSDSDNLKTATLSDILDMADGNYVLLDSGTLSGESYIEFDNTIITTTYKAYVLKLINARPSADVDFYVRVSNDNLTSVESANYENDAGAVTSAVEVTRTALVENASGTDSGLSGEIWIYDPNNASESTHITFSVAYDDSTGGIVYDAGAAVYTAQEAINGIRIFPTSGTLANGTYALYGLKTS